MMKELFLVGAAAGVGGIILGKWGGSIEAKLAGVASFVPPIAVHFVMVGASAAVVYGIGRKVL